MDIKTVYIQGAGVMGRGIAQVGAQAGYPVILNDLSDEILQKSLSEIKKSIDYSIKKGKIPSEHKEIILQRLTLSSKVEDAEQADLVIEAVFEDLEVKRRIFSKLDIICPPQTIFATNTSSLPITALAAVTNRPDRFLGIHFMNPVPIMKGVEIIRGIETSGESFNMCKEWIKKIGKEPVEAVDYAGFIVTRILDAMLNEAVRCHMDGNQKEEIDKAMKLCTNFPMGPFELMDLAGLDIVLHGLETLEKEFGDRLKPAPLLTQMVRAGRLGRKVGKGFYTH